MSASSRMAPEVDEAMSKSSWTALAKGKERYWWSIDLEGEVEKLEVRGPWSVTKGDSVDPKGEVGRRSDHTKVARKEKVTLKEDEMEVNAEAPQGRSAEIKSPRRQVIRVESEEAQDYVCGMLALSREEAEELALCVCVSLASHEDPFISATVVAVRKRSDTGGSLRRWWLKKVEKPTQLILCQQCYNEQMVQQDKPRLNPWQWRAALEKHIVGECAKSKRQQESPFRDSGGGQRKCRCGLWYSNGAERLHRNVMTAGKSSKKDAEKKRNHQNGPSRKCAELARKWREMKLDIWVEADHCASRWKVRSHVVVHLPALQQFPSGELIGHGDSNNRKKLRCSWWYAVCRGKYEWRAPNRILLVQLGTNEDEANVFRAHAVPRGLCENLINALKLLANQHRHGDSPIRNNVTGLR